MQDFPENVLRLIVEAVKKHPDNTPKAVEEAVVGVRGLPEFDSLIDSLLRGAIQEAAYDIRHNIKINVKKKREAVNYRGTAASELGDKPKRSRKRKGG